MWDPTPENRTRAATREQSASLNQRERADSCVMWTHRAQPGPGRCATPSKAQQQSTLLRETASTRETVSL